MTYEIKSIPTENGVRYQVWRIGGDSVSHLFSSWGKAAKFLRILSNQSKVENTEEK